MCRHSKSSLNIPQSIKPYNCRKVGVTLYFCRGCQQLIQMWKVAEMKNIKFIAEFVVFQTCDGIICEQRPIRNV